MHRPFYLLLFTQPLSKILQHPPKLLSLLQSSFRLHSIARASEPGESSILRLTTAYSRPPTDKNRALATGKRDGPPVSVRSSVAT